MKILKNKKQAAKPINSDSFISAMHQIANGFADRFAEELNKNLTENVEVVDDENRKHNPRS